MVEGCKGILLPNEYCDECPGFMECFKHSPFNHASHEMRGTDEPSEGQAVGLGDGKKPIEEMPSRAEEGES